MLFNSWPFIAFLVGVLAIYHSLGPRRYRAQNYLLLGASYFFYGYWDWRFLALLAISTVVDYVAALRIGASERSKTRRAWLSLSLLVNFGLLGFFKYFNFFADSTIRIFEQLGFEPSWTTLNVVLPVGISFYTLQTVGYTVDVYRGHQDPIRNRLTYAVYVAYFPQLLAGPIERAGRLLPQIAQQRHVDRDAVKSGLQLMLWGYVKKVLIADTVAPLVALAFSDPGSHGFVYLWLGAYAFAIQVYGDFSGYTDMARGMSRLLGIELMVNFRQPYFCRSFNEFWQRWHISLSTWLRDYLFISLGGSRRGIWRTYRNVFLTMLIAGLWHGAGWNFLLWGTCHGLYVSLERAFLRPFLEPEGLVRTGLRKAHRLAAILYTFHIIVITHVWFRAPDLERGWAYWRGMFTFEREALREAAIRLDGMAVDVLYCGALIFLIDLVCELTKQEKPFTAKSPWWLRGLAYGSALVLLAYGRAEYSGAFIYFQF